MLLIIIFTQPKDAKTIGHVVILIKSATVVGLRTVIFEDAEVYTEDPQT